MKTFHLLLLYLMCCTSAMAQKVDFVEIVHDGIAMSLKRQGEGRVEIVYSEVPVQLREVGVQKGSVLVSGQWGHDQIMAGTAYMFTKECGALPYPIRGVIELDNTLTIIGPTPASCEDQSLRWSEAAVLRFTPPPRQFEKQRESKREKQSKPKAKPEPRKVERRQERPRQQQDPWAQYQWRW